MTSAPRFGKHEGLGDEERESLVVENAQPPVSSLLRKAVVPEAVVRVKRDIADNTLLGQSRFERADSAAGEIAGVGGKAAIGRLVFLRHAREGGDGRDTELARFFRHRDRLLYREPTHAGQRGDLGRNSIVLAHKERENEIAGRKAGLAHEAADPSLAPQAAHPHGGEGARAPRRRQLRVILPPCSWPRW